MNRSMKLSRREFFAGALGLLATGCSTDMVTIGALPPPIWPVTPATAGRARPPAPRTPTRRSAAPAASGIQVIPRTSWAGAAPSQSNINAMNGISRITVHHEGLKAVDFADARTTAYHLEQIRQIHTRDRHWADIGYHLIVDRGGRIWEGRPLCYQGAHVRDENEHNLGVMCLGNFDEQAPSSAQLAALQRVLADFRRRYRIPASRVFTHQEIHPTKCPGATLQRHMVSLRQTGKRV